MNNRLTLLLITYLLFCGVCSAQTYYYRLTKKIEGDNVYMNTGGGQFITFADNICYESDKYGNSVKNGELLYDAYYSGIFDVFVGSSYFGKNVKFKYTKDKTLLNVETTDGRIYVYKKEEAPSSVITSTLIRNDSPINDLGVSAIPVYSSSYGNNGTLTNSLNQGNQNNADNSRRNQKTKHTCSLCRGQKRIVKDTYPALYGTKDYQVRCNECGGYFLRSTGHTHITCPQCHGKGYFTTD